MPDSEYKWPNVVGLMRGTLLLMLGGGILLSGVTPANAANKATDEKPAIPSDLYLKSKYISDEDNAIYCWRRAARALVKPDDTVSESITYAWKAESPAPGEANAAAIRHWLKQNQEALELMEQSLKKQSAQWLAKRGEEEQPELWAISYLVKARNVSADLLAAQGKWDEAVALLKGNLQLAQVAIESEAALIHYLVGTASRTTTQRAVLRLANLSNIPVATLKQLLEALPSLNSETNTYANLMRVEFTVYAYPGVDTRWFAEAWAKPKARELVSLTYPEEFQRPFMVLTDPGLVALHPKPFDQMAELDRAIATYRRYRTNALSLWTNRVEPDEAAIEKVQTELLAEIEPLMDLVAEDSLPLNQKNITKARKLYRALSDPIGRVLQCRNNLLSADDTRVFKNRTEREAVRAILAAIIFERQKEKLPASMNEMREAGLFTDLPWDYFGNTPLKYSREQRLVWSVGEDAKDDEGDGSPDAPWGGLDAVWKIPNRIK